MAEQTKVKTLEKVVIRFSGDSGDGMQLTGTIFSNLSAVFGNEISTFRLSGRSTCSTRNTKWCIWIPSALGIAQDLHTR